MYVRCEKGLNKKKLSKVIYSFMTSENHLKTKLKFVKTSRNGPISLGDLLLIMKMHMY